MDLLFIVLIAIAVHYHSWTLASVLAGLLMSVLNYASMEEVKKCNMVTTQVVVGLLRKDIADPDALRQELKNATDREAAVAAFKQMRADAQAQLERDRAAQKDEADFD